MSENRQIARAAGTVAALTLASRVTGLARDAVMSHVFGTGAAADAFFVAFRIPNLLRRFVGEGAVGAALVPTFAEVLAGRGREEADRTVRTVLTGCVVMVAALTLAGIVLAPWWLRILAPGFGAEPGLFDLTVGLTRQLFPYLLLVSVVAVLGGYLNVLRHFVAPAASPVLLNLSMIAAMLMLAGMLSPAVDALVVGVLVGGVLQIAAQVAPLRARGVVLAPRWAPRDPALRRVVHLLATSALPTAVYQINVLISTSLASVLPPGSVSYLWYAGRVFELPIGLVAVALGTAALPSFAAQAARGARAEMRHSLTFALGLVTLVAVPATVALVLLATPITAVLFQHGAFAAEDAERTAAALRAYALGLWPLAVVRVVVPAFYALRDVRAPVIAAALALLVNAAGSLACLGPVPVAAGGLLGAIGRAAAMLNVANLAHVGLAGAASLATVANLVALLLPLSRHLGGLELRTLGAALLRSALASVPMGVLIHVAAGQVDWTAPGSLPFKAVWLGVVVAGGIGAFAGAAMAVGGPEVDGLWQRARRRWPR